MEEFIGVFLSLLIGVLGGIGDDRLVGAVCSLFLEYDGLDDSVFHGRVGITRWVLGGLASTRC